MGKVIDLGEQKFRRVNAGKVVEACSQLDKIVYQLIFNENVPPSDLLPALCQRIGVYLACTDADKEKVVQKLARIIYSTPKLRHLRKGHRYKGYGPNTGEFT